MALAIVLVLIAVAATLFHFLSPWWFTPLASNWGAIDSTLIITLAITGVVFIVIHLFIAFAVARFRHRKGRRAAYNPENKSLEWWLTGLTSIGIIAMLAPGLFVYFKYVDVPAGIRVFEVLGQQWHWGFRFPGEDGVLGRSDPRLISAENPFGLSPDDPNGQDDRLVPYPEVHLPVGQPVKVLLRSKDVLHGFFVPQFRVKRDLVPGQVSSFWFTPTRTGTFEIICAELCGLGHYTMRGQVVVESEDAFEIWLSRQPRFAEPRAEEAPQAEAGLFEQGRQLARDKGCLGCHSLDGSPGVGPTWRALYGRTETLTDGSRIRVDEAYLRESILDPGVRIVQGYPPIMPVIGLSARELDALIAYLRAGPGGAETPGAPSAEHSTNR